MLNWIKELINKKKQIDQDKLYHSYLMDHNINARIDSKNKTIEFGESFFSKSIYLTQYYQYKIEDNHLIFFHRIKVDILGWFENYEHLEKKPLSEGFKAIIKSLFYDYELNNEVNEVNSYYNLTLKRNSYIKISVSEDNMIMSINIMAEKMDKTPLLIEINLSFNDEKMIINFALDGINIDKTLELENNKDPLHGIKEELKSTYFYYFLTDKTKNDVLSLSSIEEYDIEHHGNIVKMLAE